ILAAKRAVVADIGPDATGDGLELCQYRHRRVIGMNALGAQNIASKRLNDRVERNHGGADPISERRLIDLGALAPVSLTLAIERQMEQELGDQHHREQARSCKPAGNRTSEDGVTLAIQADSSPKIPSPVRYESIGLARAHPATCGRQTSCGIRQSIPDKRYESWATLTVTTPSAIAGHKKRLRSSRFENRHAPWPSCQIILIRSL